MNTDRSKDMKWEMVPYVNGVGLAVDRDMETPLFSHFISCTKIRTRAIDWERPDRQFRDLDYVFTAGAPAYVEAKQRPQLLRNWWSCLKVGGHLVLAMDRKTIPPLNFIDHMRAAAENWRLVLWKTFRDEETDLYLQVYRRTKSGGQVMDHAQQVPKNAVVLVRYGAIGDCIVASSLLPGLKEQGHHVIFNTQERGHQVLRNNPYIDEFLLQDKDQVATEELPGWWDFLARKYPRVINLSETMEGAICTIVGRSDFTWPVHLRRKHRGLNYYEFIHDLAQVPLPPRPGFYPTREETNEAIRFRRGLGEDVYLILWVLAGSAVHKRVPQIPEVMQQLLSHPDVHVVFLGDDFCTMLEEPWRDHPQVTCTSGVWSIRQALTMTQHADLVVGPETGVVQLAGIQGTPTVVFLSHTSEFTLCHYWPNYMALVAEDCACHPCYRQHVTRKYCDVDDEVPAAKCIREIPAHQISYAIEGYRASSILPKAKIALSE